MYYRPAGGNSSDVRDTDRYSTNERRMGSTNNKKKKIKCLYQDIKTQFD